MIGFLNVAGWVLLAATIACTLIPKVKDYWVIPLATCDLSWGAMAMMKGDIGFAAFWFVLAGVLLTASFFLSRSREKIKERTDRLNGEVEAIKAFVENDPNLSALQADLHKEAERLAQAVTGFSILVGDEWEKEKKKNTEQK